MSVWLTKKRLFIIHGWLGLNLGILLFAICLSGMVAVFTPELDWWLDPIRQVSPPADPNEQPLLWGELYQALHKAHPHAIVSSFMAPTTPDSAAVAVIQYPPADNRVVFIDPYKQEVTGQRTFLDIKSFIRIFHKQLYFVPDTIGFHGTLFVGIFSLILLGSVITGLCVFKRWWRAFYTIRLWRGWRIMWSDIHRCCGVWSLLIAFLLSMTGVWYFTELVLGQVEFLNREAGFNSVRDETVQLNSAALRPLGLDELVKRAKEYYPELTIDTILFPTQPQQAVTMYGQSEAVVVRSQANSISLDPYTGTIVEMQRGIDLPLSERLMHTADPLHFGTFGGLTTKVLWFVTGLALTIGILSGATVHWLRITRIQNNPCRHRYGWVISGLVTMLVLIGSAWSAVAFITDGQVSSRLQSREPVPVGTLDFTNLSGTLYLEEALEHKYQLVSVCFDDGLHIHIKEVIFEYGESAEVERGSFRALPDCLQGRVFLRKGQTFNVEQLYVKIRTADGTEYTSGVNASSSRGKSSVLVPPRPKVPAVVYWSIGGFCVALLIPSMLWLRYLRW